MRKIILMFFTVMIFSLNSAFAEEIYCGDYNGQPAYVDVDSIRKEANRTGDWEVTSSGVYPIYSHSYVANIYADGLWYEVHFSVERQNSYLAWILDKNKKNTHKSIHTINFDFAFPTVEEYYPEANRRHEEAARKKLEEIDRKTIEEAKRNNS